REMGYLKIVEQTTKKRMQPMKPPTWDEAFEGQQRVTMDRINDVIKENDLQNYISVARDLLNENDAINVTAAALKLLTKEPDKTPVHISEERPLPKKKRGFNQRSRRGGTRGGYNHNRNPRRKSRRT